MLLTSVVLVGCADSSGSPARSALLITLDTTRYDALSINGGVPGTTPNLDRLAREGVSFDQAYTVAPLTLPAHASMLTGLYPPRHTVRSNGTGRLPESAQTIAESARTAGVQTAAFVSAVVLADAFGLDQGFERYDVPALQADRTQSHYAARPASDTVDRARAWLAQRDRSRPFFLWVHLWDPHAPLDPPPHFRGTTPEPYLDEVAAMDDAIGNLIDSLRDSGDLEQTTVLVVADHGEAFGEHGEFSHGAFCFQTTLRVPIILRQPGDLRAGHRTSNVVSVVDVAPTLAEVMGLAFDNESDGTSLLHAVDSPVAATRGVYFESYYGFLNYDWSPLTGWLDARGKYLHSSSPRFFNPRAAGGEETDLSTTRSDELARYRASISAVAERPALTAEALSTSDTTRRDALRKLGYAAVGAPTEALPHPLATSPRPSPMERLEENRNVLLALGLVNDQRFAEAEALYVTILNDNPRNFEALENVAYCRLRLGRFEDAVSSYEAALDSGRGSANAMTYLGVSLRALGHNDRAMEQYLRAMHTNPTETEALWQMIDILESLERSSEAEEYRQRLSRLTEVH